MSIPTTTPIYQLRIRLDRISPLIWRHLLVSDATTIAELHAIIQIAFGWSDPHVHRFVIHGKSYGNAYPGGRSTSAAPHNCAAQAACPCRATTAPHLSKQVALLCWSSNSWNKARLCL